MSEAPSAGRIRSEPRLIRPFFAVEWIDDALKESRLRLFRGDQPAPGPFVHLSPDRKSEVEPAVVLPDLLPVLRRLDDTGLRKSVRIFVVGYREVPRVEMVLAALKEDDLPNGPIELPVEPVRRLFRGPKVEIRVALCLSDVPSNLRPGIPRRPGQWLAAKRFRIGSTEERRFFDIERVERSRWVQLGYPEDTLFRVEKKGGIDGDPPEDGIATLQLHASAYDRLIHRDDGAARAAKAMLLEQVALAILDAFRSDIREVGEPEPASVLSGLLQRLSKAGVGEWNLDRLKNALDDDEEERQKLRATLTVLFGSVQRIGEGL